MNTECCPPAAGVNESTRKPRYQVDGDQNAHVVRIEMPGVPKSGVKIDLDKDLLTIRGDRVAAAPPNGKTLHRELSDLHFLLRLRLNTPVDESRMTATMEDGVLQLTLPVKEAAKPRRIEVQ